jgi:hypothetical protein
MIVVMVTSCVRMVAHARWCRTHDPRAYDLARMAYSVGYQKRSTKCHAFDSGRCIVNDRLRYPSWVRDDIKLRRKEYHQSTVRWPDAEPARRGRVPGDELLGLDDVSRRDDERGVRVERDGRGGRWCATRGPCA